MSRRLPAAITLFMVLAGSLYLISNGVRPAPSKPEAAKSKVSETYGKLPLAFEENRGQVDAEVKFLTRGPGYHLFLTPTEAVFTLFSAAPITGKPTMLPLPDRLKPEMPEVKTTVLRMKMVGANPTLTVAGEAELPGKVNYFIGNEPDKWRTNIPAYGRVAYQEVYPGIDLVYRGEDRKLEFDFVVQPGANPEAIRLALEGSAETSVVADEAGNLQVTVADRQVQLSKPLVYQETAQGRREVEGRFVALDANRIGFKLGGYDVSLPVIIDPVLSYSVSFGGSDEDVGMEIATDNVGNAYVTGYTKSLNYPTSNPLQATLGGDYDAFVTKLNSNGSAFVYSTFLGGSGNDQANCISMDATGAAYLTGYTYSSNFPVASAFQQTHAGERDAFVTKIGPSGATLDYSTFLGGKSWDVGFAIALDTSGNAFLAGMTNSTDFPIVNPFQAMSKGGQIFITKLSLIGPTIIYSTHLGGSTPYDYANGIAVDSSGSAYVTGCTLSADFPVRNPLQSFNLIPAGYFDAFLTKLSSDGLSLVFSTYLGGNYSDCANGIALDPLGNAVITGYTDSSNFPTRNAFQSQKGSYRDAFITKVASDGSAIIYSTYLGGGQGDEGQAVASDSLGNAYVLVSTSGDSRNNLPILNPFDVPFPPCPCFVAKLLSNGVGMAFSAYAPTANYSGDTCSGIAHTSSGGTFILGGTYNVSVAQITERQEPSDLSIAVTAPTNAITLGSMLTYAVTLTNLGPNPAIDVRLYDRLPESANFMSVSSGGAACSQYYSHPLVSCSFGTIQPSQSASVSINVQPTIASSFPSTAHISSANIDPDTSNNVATATATVVNPVPFISKLNPTSVVPGSPAFILTVTGTDFVPNSKIRWNGLDRVTTNYISSSQLSTPVSALEIASAGTASITVFNPIPGGGESNAMILIIGQPTTTTTTTTSTTTRATTTSSTTTSTSSTTTSSLPPGAYALYFPHVLSNSVTRTVLTIANSSTRTANLTFRTYDTLGRLISGIGITNPVNRQLPAGQQLIQQAWQIFGNDFITPGAWVEVLSDNPSLNGFYSFQDDAGLVLDGAAAFTAGFTEMVLPEVAETTYINLANPSAFPKSVSLRVTNRDGIVVAAQVQILASKGCADLRMGDIFAPGILDNASYLSINSAYPIVAAEVLGAGTVYLSVINALETGGGATQLYAPHYPFGGNLWTSVVSIINPTESSTTATIQVINDSGAPVGQNLTLTLPARGKAFISDPIVFGIFNSGPVTLAYLKISGPTRLLGSVRFSYPLSPQLQAMMPLSTGGSASGIIPYWTQAGGFSSSLISLNGTGQAATVAYSLFGDDGRLLTTASRSMPANGRDTLPIAGTVPANTRGYATYQANPSAVVFGLISGQSLSSMMVVPAQSWPTVPTTSTTTTSTTTTSTTLPTVGSLRGYLDRPEANSTVSGVVTIAGWAAIVSGQNAGPVRRIELLSDGGFYSEITERTERKDVQADLASKGIQGPANLGFTGMWDTRTLMNGRHTLAIRAYDATSAYAELANFTVTVSNPVVTTSTMATTTSTVRPTTTTSLPYCLIQESNYLKNPLPH